MRIGIDVGGTNTDAVLIDGTQLVASFKTPTTPDLLSGIDRALRGVLPGGREGEVEVVMLGTTHFANALVQAKGLTPTAAVRLALPSGAALPPFVDWPEALREKVDGGAYMLPGGYEFDGREMAPFEASEVRRVARAIRANGIRAAAISSAFSPIKDDMERAAADILLEENPDLRLTRSSDIGSVGLLERENAAILNATLLPLAEEVVDALGAVLRSTGLRCPFYLTQNDGTLMSRDYARRYPVRTISSGPTNSMRGAAFLSGVKDAMVIDFGGTTTDIGVLIGGFPRPAAKTVTIAGVRTNFRMPDVQSLGLGGGSLVRVEDGAVGPESVGYRLTDEALVFGGGTLTATDLAVAAGRAEVGEAGRALIGRADAARLMRVVDEMVAATVDRMKPSREALPAVIVGGGSILAAGEIPGISEIIRPEHFEVANALGAAIAQVGGEIDRIFDFAAGDRERIIREAHEEAKARAVGAGADPASVEVVESEEIPLAYLPTQGSRIRVKAVGDLREVR